MTRRFKWLVPILILSLLLASVAGVSCTPDMLVHVLISSILCGIEVWIDGSYEGSLDFGQAWGLCMLELMITEGTHTLDFVVPGSTLAATASARGMQVTASEIPDITLTYDGPIVHGSRYEINICSAAIDSGAALSAQNGNEPYLASIVVEVSDTPFEPHPLVYPSISCEPSSFTVMLNPNTACSNTMRIRNEGDAPLTYDLAEAVPHELIYDDGEVDSATVQPPHYTSCPAVRFTPSLYPVTLDTARIYLYPNWPDSDHEQFAVEVYDDDGAGGAPGSLLETVYTTATHWGWWDVDMSGLGITITNGDFYIAYRQLTTYPDCEALSIDFDQPHYYRSWSKYGDTWFQLQSDENYMIRCVVEVSEDCPWLDESPKSGSVEPGNSDSISININTVGLAPGDYEAQIIVASNDPSDNPITVPVSLLVNNPPNTLSSPVPANHAVDVDINAGLSWSGGDPDVSDTVTYDVYFGTSSIPPFAETIGPYSADQTSVTYIPGTLDYDTRYYWKMLATDTHEVSAIGSVWDFTTQAMHLEPFCVDFEADPRSGDAPLEVDFDPTWTSGGLTPYVKMGWDFDGDSVVDETVTGSWATPADLPATSYIYECAGIYAPSLTITESTAPEPLVATNTKIGYIEVTGRKGDFDNDGDIDIFDFVYFADAYGSEAGDTNYNAIGDFDDDGDIDIFDFVYFADVYGT